MSLPTFNPRDIRPFITPNLKERILAKLDFRPNGCIWWTGAYNSNATRSGARKTVARRPVIYIGGGKGGRIVYVAPLILAMAGEGDLQPIDHIAGVRLFACHTCKPCGDGWYRCVAEDHLRWGTRSENEQDKKQVERLPAGHEEVPDDGSSDNQKAHV